MKKRKSFAPEAAIATCVLLIALILSLGSGALGSQVWLDPQLRDAVGWQLRLPRTLAALAVGVGLALTGAALQGLFRNPLADPGITGAGACALPPAIAVIYYGNGSPHWTAAAAAVGALCGGHLCYLLSRRSRSLVAPLFIGAALNGLAAAAAMWLLARAPDPYALSSAVFWSFGGLADRTMPQALAAAVAVIIGGAFLLGSGPALARLNYGDEAAGINLQALRRRILLGSALVIGGCTAAAGPVAGVGLFVPHAVRALGSGHPQRVLPLSALWGGCAVVGLDTAQRLCGLNVPIGVLTAPLGAIVLLWAALRRV